MLSISLGTRQSPPVTVPVSTSTQPTWITEPNVAVPLKLDNPLAYASMLYSKPEYANIAVPLKLLNALEYASNE